ncbi:hypothetical protein ACN38_g7887 [Penicillium nordicum]|uniref:Uncharacterized protein n=1 Tax=Penicillium nordicum TaxID=229535 RepID=A0A0M8P688_9EURO|nr:hypothetical protein ACN38_g7887 [Penicillium nordicum]
MRSGECIVRNDVKAAGTVMKQGYTVENTCPPGQVSPGWNVPYLLIGSRDRTPLTNHAIPDVSNIYGLHLFFVSRQLVLDCIK